MNLVTVVNNCISHLYVLTTLLLYREIYWPRQMAVMLSSLKIFQKRLRKRFVSYAACGELNVPNFKNFETGPVTCSYLE